MTKLINKKINTIRKLPANIDFKDIELFQSELQRMIPPSRAILRKNLLVVNYSIFGLRFPNLVIKDAFFEKPGLKKILKDTIKNILTSKKEIETINKACWIVDNKSTVYFHFICDALSRAIMVEEKLKQYPVLLTPALKKNTYVKEILDNLDIPYIQMEKKFYFVRELLLTSHASPSGNYNPLLIKRISNKFQNENKFQNKNERIWIDRKNERRDIINFHEIEKILEKFNFKTTNFQDMSLKDKKEILSNTEYLMGVFGSGLTNIIMMPKGSKLIELRNRGDKANNAFFSLSSELEIPYLYFEVDVIGHITHGNVEINPVEFEKFLESIFNN